MHETLKIKIDFANERRRPEEIFQAMSNYIEAYQAIGQVLASSLGSREEFALRLEKVEAASVASVLRAVPGLLKEWIETAIFESSIKLAENLSETQSTSTEEEVNQLASILEESFAKFNTDQMLGPTIDRKAFAHALSKLSEANKATARRNCLCDTC